MAVKEGYVTSSPVTFTIDLDDIQRSVDDFEKMQDAMERGAQKGLEAFADRFYERVKIELEKFGLGGSELAHSVAIIRDSDGFIVTCADYGVYVEYGTGLIGEMNPHPSPQIPWEYDVNEHGEDGWKYVDGYGKLRWTAGQPSRPFMYNAWLWGRRSYHNIIMGYIRREVKSALKGR